MLAEADELVVLSDDLGGAFGEVEGEGGLVGPKVVDVEDKFLGEVFWGTPDYPAYSWVNKAVSVDIRFRNREYERDQRTCDQKC